METATDECQTVPLPKGFHIEQEEALRTKSSADVAAEFPAIVERFKWIKSFDKETEADGKVKA
jgi:hypothetical protein